MEHIAYSDPHVAELTVRLPQETLEMTSVELSEEVLRAHDVVVILTDHSAFPYAQIAEQARAIVDTRHALRDVPHDPRKVLLLGGGTF